MLKNLKASTRIKGTLALLVALLVCAVGVALLQMGKMGANAHEITANWMRSISVVNAMSTNTLDFRIGKYRHVTITVDADMAKVEQDIASVSLNTASRPMCLKLDLVSGFSTEAIANWAKASLLPNATVLSDGLACFAAVTEAGCIHTPRVVGALKPRELPEFKWVHTLLGNLKTMLAGEFKALKFGN